MGKSGPKLSEAKAEKLRKGVRAIIKANKDLQAAVNALRKSSKSKDTRPSCAAQFQRSSCAIHFCSRPRKTFLTR